MKLEIVNLENELSLVQIKTIINTSNSLKKERISYLITKRLFDIFIGIIGCIALAPIACIIFIANKISKDKGPVFYIQKRIGKNGKTFKMIKFRSMYIGAEENLEEYLNKNESLKLEYEKYKKLKDDPRITKVGRFIRKISLDEFPQVINIIKGDMSVVGNRPYLLQEKDEMGENFSDITRTKPGLTGLWQTHGRSDVTFKDRLRIEKFYSEKCNVLLDIKILIKTIKVVLMGI